MTEARKKIRIFFSWQSDLDQEVTTRAIRAALRAAMTTVEKDYPVDIDLEEATSNVAGSPYIPYALADKISKADIFVGDITTVVRLTGQTGKSLPNANVTFELGIASAELGWNRIIMLFNTALARLEDLPFDFDRHRISKFNFSTDANSRKSHESDLRKLAHAAIAQIVADDPKRPRELQQVPPEQIKKSRDIENLRWFLHRINTAYLDRHIQEMPAYLEYSAVLMYEGVEELQRRSDFLFYDPDLTVAVDGIIANLRVTLAHNGQYRDTNNLVRQAFGRPGDMDLLVDESQRKAWDEIDAARYGLKSHLDRLIAIVRERYMEVDIDKTNPVFAKAYASVRSSLREDEQEAQT
ncbi:hypothetical protein CQ14_09655 [Bradyrhizobium lablabi]|uniref:CD-NTase-associated protein 12/Pycsar effector protein TIR domain-containing protein n=1 Tax=Bradyrhizobium lablabi TaxID=722472 RepID=A0A0R3N635_9BRAD|nr:hypothetical protein [Bradyrhizobium lablabi]KRR25267.1 hypothetical protein CQ14_09655 [Bradyrhizobium lablabi]